MSRDDLKDAAQRIQLEVESIYMSEPLRMYNFERFAWLTFKTEEIAQSAMQKEWGEIMPRHEEFWTPFLLQPMKST